MKKNVLALSIATLIGGLGFTGTASAALEVAESGAGHILLVPYYTAQEGNMSIFHLTNTDTVNGKAVKVRFRGASNSDDVLDFQVFMSPGDVWTGIVQQNPATGLANLLTADKSCTLPSIAAAGQDFITTRLSRAAWNAEAKAKETLEGYVEILNMADIPSDGTGNKGPNSTNGLFNAIKHVNGVAPCTSNVIRATADLDRTAAEGWDPVADAYHLQVGAAPRNLHADLVPPTGGLTGQWYIQNLTQNTAFSGVMHAVSPTTATWNVFSAQMEEPARTLVSADPLLANSWGGGDIRPQNTPDANVPLLRAQKYDVPDLSTPYEINVGDPTVEANAATQAAALTSVLARTAVINQYATDPELDAKTDWVFSMPTRRYTVAANYAVTNVQNAAYRVRNRHVPAANSLFTNIDNTTVNAAGQICAASGKTVFWDREEQTVTAPGKQPVFSPSSPEAPESYTLCGEVGVLSFQEGDSALGAVLTRQNVKAPYTNGWGHVPFHANGVPVLGAAFLKVNGIGGVNYGVTWNHTYDNKD